MHCLKMNEMDYKNSQNDQETELKCNKNIYIF